jgi:hypothetical protein
MLDILTREAFQPMQTNLKKNNQPLISFNRQINSNK